MNNALKHHGILGMKWGVRRYQNKDGSLTTEGKKRYREDWSSDAKDTADVRKKTTKQMSNAELRKVIDRMNLEKQYSQLKGETEIIGKGKKYIDKFIKAGKTVTEVTTAVAAVYGGYKKVKNVLDKIHN